VKIYEIFQFTRAKIKIKMKVILVFLICYVFNSYCITPLNVAGTYTLTSCNCTNGFLCSYYSNITQSPTIYVKTFSQNNADMYNSQNALICYGAQATSTGFVYCTSQSPSLTVFATIVDSQAMLSYDFAPFVCYTNYTISFAPTPAVPPAPLAWYCYFSKRSGGSGGGGSYTSSGTSPNTTSTTKSTPTETMCFTCSGSGKNGCGSCSRTGKLQIIGGYTNCSRCGGSGYESCNFCGGSGKKNC